jgi:hypothetical protein
MSLGSARGNEGQKVDSDGGDRALYTEAGRNVGLT